MEVDALLDSALAMEGKPTDKAGWFPRDVGTKPVFYEYLKQVKQLFSRMGSLSWMPR